MFSSKYLHDVKKQVKRWANSLDGTLALIRSDAMYCYPLHPIIPSKQSQNESKPSVTCGPASASSSPPFYALSLLLQRSAAARLSAKTASDTAAAPLALAARSVPPSLPRPLSLHLCAYAACVLSKQHTVPRPRHSEPAKQGRRQADLSLSGIPAPLNPQTTCLSRVLKQESVEIKAFC